MADEPVRYKIWDRVEKEYLKPDYTSKDRARSIAASKDAEYGSGRYAVDPVTYKEGASGVLAWRGRNDQATSVRGGHALAERLGLVSFESDGKEEERKKISAEKEENLRKKLSERNPDFDMKSWREKLHKATPWASSKTSGGGSGGAPEDRREAQLGADLDPKSMMKREGYKKGGKVSSASSRGDGIAQRGKTKGRMV